MNNYEKVAYMFVDETEIGVTDNLIDVIEKLKRQKAGSVLKVAKGYLPDLLDLQQTILSIDEVINACGENNILIPDRQTDINLVGRRVDPQKIKKFYMLEEPKPVNCLGTLEGGEYDVR